MNEMNDIKAPTFAGGNIPIIGQKTRQQRREEERQITKNIGPFMTRTVHLFNRMGQDMNLLHMRVNIAFETMRLLGATDEQIEAAAAQAESRVQELEAAKLAQVQEHLQEEQLLTQPEETQDQAPEDERGIAEAPQLHPGGDPRYSVPEDIPEPEAVNEAAS